MLDAPVGFAFGAGAVAAFNPCGFALLPAYLGLFLATADADAAEDDDGDGTTPVHVGVATGLLRAAWVAVVVVAGFVAVFGVAAVLISQTAVTVQEYTPWITLGVGALLVPAGIAVLRGWTPKLRLPTPGRRVGGTGPSAMFWFGVSYAIVSLSCTIPAFLVAVVGTFTSSGAGSGLVVFAAYTAGMSAVLVTVTVVVATARQGMLARLRRVLPYVGRVSGALAVVAGAYVAYYGWYEIRLNAGGNPPSGPVEIAGTVSGRLTTWVDAVPAAAWLLSIAAIGGLAVLRARAPAPRGHTRR